MDKNALDDGLFTINCKGRLLVIDRPWVMGIINSTPDSFYEGSRFRGADFVLRQAEKMLEEGAGILDIGGQSTRPGSPRIDAEEELDRVIASIEALHKHFPDAIISIDSYYSRVAKEAVGAGACIVNDISGGNFDPFMIESVANLGVPFICMHSVGTPDTMHQRVSYEDVCREVLDYLSIKVAVCREAGIADVIIDPGFGFSKSIGHNFLLLKNLSILKMLGKPILAGISRKSTIYKTLGISAGQSLNGTTVLNTIGLLNGANILRVHDVKEAVEVVKLVGSLERVNRDLPD